MNKEIPEEYIRFNIIERIQHIILFTTFLLLTFTGWAVKYPEVQQSQWWIRIWGGPETAGIIHRVAGITMLFDFVWHVVYMIYRIVSGKISFHKYKTLIPLPTDLTDLVKNLMYFMGASREKPQFGRFSYLHKFDYWAVFWGMAIIALSGLFLTFPVQASYLFPAWSVNWIWELIFIMHSDEALLAIVFILFFHFYNEHLRWEHFPMNMVWLTGRLTMEKMKHEHPLEYELEFGDKKEVDK